MALLLAQATTGARPVLPDVALRVTETVVGAGVAVAVSYLASWPGMGRHVLRSAVENVRRAAARASGTGRRRDVALLRRRLDELDTAATRTAGERLAVRREVAELAEWVDQARTLGGDVLATLDERGCEPGPGDHRRVRSP